MISDDCTSNIHEFCSGHCQCDCHGILLDEDEVRGLYKAMEKQFVNPKNRSAHSALNRMIEWIKKKDS